jgi:tRNA-specific 2-thiouridylase
VTGRLKVVVAMSGGVDSSVAAALLKEQGHDVVGITMRVWPSAKTGGIRDAGRVAAFLGIPHHVLDLQGQFEEVVDYFCQEYLKGCTPNPCVYCNRTIKFGALWARARALGASRLATGHYARSERDLASGRYILRRGLDRSKDQSYVLWGLGQDQLGIALFPLGGLRKVETRGIARKVGLPVAEKGESQEICFIQGDYGAFIKDRSPHGLRPGPIMDQEGNVLGTHKGIHLYTIGQRRGLGVSLGKPLYVVEIDLARNAVVLGPAGALEARGLVARPVNFVSIAGLAGPTVATVQVRYRAAAVEATLYPEGEGVRVLFSQPERAVTPGQSAVFYQGDLVLGGGVIHGAVK